MNPLAVDNWKTVIFCIWPSMSLTTDITPGWGPFNILYSTSPTQSSSDESSIRRRGNLIYSHIDVRYIARQHKKYFSSLLLKIFGSKKCLYDSVTWRRRLLPTYQPQQTAVMTGSDVTTSLGITTSHASPPTETTERFSVPSYISEKSVRTALLQTWQTLIIFLSSQMSVLASSDWLLLGRELGWGEVTCRRPWCIALYCTVRCTPSTLPTVHDVLDWQGHLSSPPPDPGRREEDNGITPGLSWRR